MLTSKNWIKKSLPFFTIIFFILSLYFAQNKNSTSIHPPKIKVYWFIPDGLRADREQFNIYEWANNNELPNLRKLMARGSYGYSRPVFPGHTPTNFATLLTGVYPDRHGVADGAMRTFGYPLKMVSKGGFSSFSKLVEPIWVELENSDYLVSLQSIPGSTPPEIFRGNVIRGRWGSWGIDFPSMIIQSSESPDKSYRDIGNNRRVFTLGPELTTIVKKNSKSEYTLNIWGETFKISPVFYSEKLDQFNSLKLSVPEQNIQTVLKADQWSNWFPIKLNYQLKNDYQVSSPKKMNWENELSTIKISTNIKFKVIAIEPDGNFRVRLLIDSLNEYVTSPENLYEKMTKKLGPMVDFVDNYPPQLVYHAKDKQTFLEEANLSWNWHQNVVKFLINDLNSDFIIHSIYNPNQMLTSRWWLPYIDNNGHLSKTVSSATKNALWKEVKQMYLQVDNILGEILKNSDENTYIIFSSDHGVIPLNKEIKINNLFAKKGWLKFYFNENSKNFEIDWAKTKVVFLQMNNIYINPTGLDGPYTPSTSKEYFKLRSEVIAAISSLKDPVSNKRATAFIWKREQMKEIRMPQNRVGDLVISPINGFSWVEDVSDDGAIFTKSVKGGYKQALRPENIEGMLTPFLIAGPGIKSNYKIENIINHVDQYATIADITKIKHPTKPKLDGVILKKIFY